MKCGTFVRARVFPQTVTARYYSRGWYWGSNPLKNRLPGLKQRWETYVEDGRLEYWLSLITQYGPDEGRVVEIGCAPGILMHRLSEQGYDCVGVEVSPDVVDWVKRKTGLDIRCGLFQDVDTGDLGCELFLAMDVLEHASNPLTFVKQAAELLLPGGTAIFQTPIERCFSEEPFKNAPQFMADYDHRFIFTERSIRELSAISGLTLVDIGDGWAKGHEFFVLRKVKTDLRASQTSRLPDDGVHGNSGT